MEKEPELKPLLFDTMDAITNLIDGDMEEYPELAAINERLWAFYNKTFLDNKYDW